MSKNVIFTAHQLKMGFFKIDYLSILGPEGHKAPVKQAQDVLTVRPRDGEDLLSGGHVIVGRGLAGGFIDGEIRLELFDASESDEATAHSAPHESERRERQL